MLNFTLTRKIEEFVLKEPRSIQEIAEFLGKNWRTADRYISQIIEEKGTITTKTYRKGTRGALKIVYASTLDKISDTSFQEKLEQEIMRARNKDDFSAFDIFQYVKDKNKRAILEKEISEDTTNLKELVDILRNTQKELISLSGNLSYINLKKGEIDIFSEIENLIKKGVKMKVICHVDIVAKENIEKLLSLNHKYATEAIEIRHHEMPVRAFIFDRQILRIKEIKEPTGKINELDKKLYIFYTIKDKVWAEWMYKIFNKIFNNSIGAKKRLEEIDKIFLKR